MHHTLTKIAIFVALYVFSGEPITTSAPITVPVITTTDVLPGGWFTTNYTWTAEHEAARQLECAKIQIKCE